VQYNSVAGSGPTKLRHAACIANTSAISFPSTPWWPWTQTSMTL